MIPLSELLLFAGACFLLVITPGPNMLYLISRSVCQGRAAGVISLCGVMAGFGVHMLGAAIGLAAVVMAIPIAFAALKWGGALYLAWLAYETLKPGAQSPFVTTNLPPDSPRKLFMMGYIINILNPKVAMFYIALFPQFIDPARGSVFIQSMILGMTQSCISFVLDLAITLSAATIAQWFAHNPKWLAMQRYVMGFVLAALAIRIMLEPQRL